MFNNLLYDIKNNFGKNYKIDSKNLYLDVLIKNYNFPSCWTSIEILAYKDVNKIAICKNLEYNWFHEKIDRNFKLNNNSNIYHFSSLDIGAIVKLHVKEIGTNSNAVITFDKIIIEDSLKIEIENNLLKEYSKFKIQINNDLERFNLILNESNIIVDLNSKEIKLDFNIFEICQYSENENSIFIEILLNKIDEKNLETLTSNINFKEYNNKKGIIMKFQTREMKEIFIITKSLIYNIKIMSFYHLFNNIESIISRKSLFDKNKKITTSDILLELENLKKVVKNMINFNKKIIQEKEKIENYMLILEKDLKFTISEYKTFISEISVNKNIDIKKKIEHLNDSLLVEKSQLQANIIINTGEKNNISYNDKYLKLKNKYKKLKNLNQLLFKELKKYEGKNASLYLDTNKLSNFESFKSNIHSALLEDIESKNLKEELNCLESENKKLKNDIIELNYKLNNHSNNFLFTKVNNIEDLFNEIRDFFEGKKDNLFGKEIINIDDKYQILLLENKALNEKLDLFKTENEELRMDNKSINNSNPNQDNLLKKQLISIKEEIKLFKQQNWDLMENNKKLKLEITDNKKNEHYEKIIENLTHTNNCLIEELNRLQE